MVGSAASVALLDPVDVRAVDVVVSAQIIANLGDKTIEGIGIEVGVIWAQSQIGLDNKNGPHPFTVEAHRAPRREGMLMFDDFLVHPA